MYNKKYYANQKLKELDILFKKTKVEYNYITDISGFSNVISLPYNLYYSTIKLIVTCYMTEHVDRIKNIFKGLDNKHFYKIARVDTKNKEKIWLTDKDGCKFWIEIEIINSNKQDITILNLANFLMKGLCWYNK